MEHTCWFWGKSQARTQLFSCSLRQARSRIVSQRSKTSTQWYSSHLPYVHVSIFLSSARISSSLHDFNLSIKILQSAGCKFQCKKIKMHYLFNWWQIQGHNMPKINTTKIKWLPISLPLQSCSSSAYSDQSSWFYSTGAHENQYLQNPKKEMINTTEIMCIHFPFISSFHQTLTQTFMTTSVTVEIHTQVKITV